MRRAVAAALVAGLLAGAPATAQEVRSAEQHRDRLREARAVARAGVDDPTPARLGEIRDLVGGEVLLHVDGRRVRLGPDPLLARLDGRRREDLRLASEHLATLGEELGATVRTPPLDPDLDAALARSYDGVHPTLALRERVLRAVGDALQRLLSPLARDPGLAGTVAWVLLLAAALGLAVWLARRLRVVPDATVRRRERADGPEVDWRRRADEALARGDLEGALRAAYRALLHELDRRDVVDDAPSLTPAECRTTVARARPDLATAVASATGAFERVVYGRAPVDRQDVEAVRRAEEAVRT